VGQPILSASNGTGVGTSLSPSPSPGRFDTVRCTAHPCGHIKGCANHWFICWSDDPAGMFHCVGYDHRLFELIGEAARPVCGSGCAQKLLERFLSGEAI